MDALGPAFEQSTSSDKVDHLDTIKAHVAKAFMEGSSRNGSSLAEGKINVLVDVTGRTIQCLLRGQAVEAPTVDQCHQPRCRQQSPP